MAGIVLRGMTWRHPRGYDPLIACAAAWRARTGVEIVWDQRSLQDFETYPVEDLARRYDLIVIDHPHVGQITREGCLAPFGDPAREAEAKALAAASVGPSWPSYFWAGAQWALPIDAATQVMAYRPDLVARPPAQWSDMLELARAGAVLCPMRAPHALMCLYTLSGNLGRPGAVEGPDLFDERAGAESLERLAELMSLVDARCWEWDPIAVFDVMTESGSRFACAPLIYGYVSYAFERFRPHRLRFADIPSLGANGPVGSALGGTGLAVSAFSRHGREAADFAWWAAGAEAQAGLYASSGGQPAHDEAWRSETVNAPTADFYRATRRTLDGAWLRPRHDGYMPFQDAASKVVSDALRSRRPARATVAQLNAMYRETLRA